MTNDTFELDDEYGEDVAEEDESIFAILLGFLAVADVGACAEVTGAITLVRSVLVSVSVLGFVLIGLFGEFDSPGRR